MLSRRGVARKTQAQEMRRWGDGVGSPGSMRTGLQRCWLQEQMSPELRRGWEQNREAFQNGRR
jgi:hypothetical protein